MRKVSLLPGMILLGIGLFYSFQKLNIHLFEYQNSWQTLLVIFGLAYLVSGHFEKDNNAILPGIILLGLGIHFIFHGKQGAWPDHPQAFLFILAIGILLTALKTKKGFTEGLFILGTGLFLHFFQSIIRSLTVVESGVQFIEGYWPFLVIIIGAFLLIKKRRK